QKDFYGFTGLSLFGGGGPGPQLEQKFDIQCLRNIPCSGYMSEKKEYRFPDRLARPTDNASIADQRGSKATWREYVLEVQIDLPIDRLAENRCKEHHI